MTLSTAAKIAGTVGVVGGASMVAVGAVNANTANNSQSDDDKLTATLDALEQAGVDNGVDIDMSYVREESEKAATHVDRWQGAGLTTAISGGIALGTGIAGLMTGGPVGTALRGISIASGLFAGGAALYGLNSYVRGPEHAERATYEMQRELEGAALQLQARRGLGPQGGAATATAASPSVIWETPVGEPVSRSTHDAIARADIKGIQERYDSVVPVDEYANDLAQIDGMMQAEMPDTAIASRRTMSYLSGIDIPSTGSVDWRGVSEQLDVDGDTNLTSEERAALRLGGVVSTYARAARDMSMATGNPNAAYEPGFLAAALDGTAAPGQYGEALASLARTAIYAAGWDLNESYSDEQLDNLQDWMMSVAAENGG